MKLGNLACGAVRPQSEEWWNIDMLHPVLAPRTPERTQLDSEPRYCESDISKPLPFPDNEFDALLASHCIEHFTLLESVAVLKECLRILKPQGFIVVSVPNASVFQDNYKKDTIGNALSLYGEPIYPGEGSTFMEYAGFNRFHKQLFSHDSLWCVLTQAGFAPQRTMALGISEGNEILEMIKPIINRWAFSLVMVGMKV